MKASSPVGYRKASLKDSAMILQIERACFSAVDAFKPYHIRHFLNNKNGSIHTDIILYHDQPCGWAAYFTRRNSKVIRLYTICVMPEFAGKGIGYSYLSQRIAGFGSYRTVSLEVRATNTHAIRLYEKLGFKSSATLPGYYPDGEDGLKMVRPL